MEYVGIIGAIVVHGVQFEVDHLFVFFAKLEDVVKYSLHTVG